MPSEAAGPQSDMSLHLLVVKPTALGDVAQALPVAAGIKKARPDWRLTWVVDEDYIPLVEASPHVDRILPFPRRRWRREGGGLKEWIPWSLSLRRLRPDVTLDLQGLARSGWMTWASGAGRRVGLASAREGSFLAYQERVDDRAVHAVDRYWQAAEQVVGAPLDRTGAALRCPEVALLPKGLRSGAYHVLHPYSLWETKLWPWRNYGALAAAHPGESFVLIGQGGPFPVDAERVTDLRGRLPLAVLLAVLAHARSVISTDSGPAHVAAAFGVPVVCLFGATDPGRTAPRGPECRVVSLDGLECRPCLQRECTRAVHPMECLSGLSVEQVSKVWRGIPAVAVTGTGAG